MYILVINAGSSSLKYQLIDMETQIPLAKGLAERIGTDGGNLKHKPTGKPSIVIDQFIKDHKQAIRLMLDALMDAEHGVISSMDEIHAVGHRVVHGGEKFAASVVISDEVMEAILDNVDLAPLHNPANLMGIEACLSAMPNTPMVAVFDTAFHQSMPAKAYMYGLPYKYYKEYKVRRYGFHGTSHRYVSKRTAEFLGRRIQDLKIITCHIGNGSSICAIDGGKSIDTSMGMTPLEGILMGTRSGNIDPALIEYLMKQCEMSIDDVMNVLNKESGLIGVSEISSDMRDIEGEYLKGNKRAILAVEVLCYGIRKYVGSYAAAMGGVDAVVITAGIGENNPFLREKILENMEFLGLKIDTEKNQIRQDEIDFSAEDSRVSALVIATNEELMIAQDVEELVN